jgi:hypothetical protein
MPDGVSLRIERAKEHIRDLEIRIAAFKGLDPYRVICNKISQPNSREKKTVDKC